MLGPVDVEGEVVTLLTGAADSVGTEVPNPRTDTIIRVTRAGGSARNAMQADVRLLIECWAADSVAAFNLAATAYARLRDRYGPADVWGGRAGLADPVNFPDPDTESPRYQFVATILTDLQEVSA